MDKKRKGGSGYQPPMTPQRVAKLEVRRALRAIATGGMPADCFPGGYAYEDACREDDDYAVADARLGAALAARRGAK